MANAADNVLTQLRDEIRTFVAERDWEQFHTPKNLAASLVVEAAELLEPFQWLRTGELLELSDRTRGQVEEELADVLIQLIRLADKLNVDLAKAARDKLIVNAGKYPADLVRGDARKYTDY